ncbi:MAG: formylglycine-generating enzyme family protein [Candidatus Nitrospinota bacterium M3_3B_026]
MKASLAASIILLSALAALPASAEKILIPEGFVLMGTDTEDLAAQIVDNRAKVEWYADETPRRKVEIGAFLIDDAEVTNAEYEKAVPDHKYPRNLEDHPVVNVTWEEAAEYCKNAGGRLPTEAEWERAARGDDGRVYPWGNEFDPSKVVYMGSSGEDSGLKIGSFELETSASSLLGGTSPAGSRPGGASPFGVLDMAGNVWEWVDGWHDKDKMLRTLKGGSWLSPAASVRSAARLPDSGRGRFNDYGFRCAYDAE